MNTQIIASILLILVAVVSANYPLGGVQLVRVAPIYQKAQVVAAGYTPGNNVISRSSSGPGGNIFVSRSSSGPGGLIAVSRSSSGPALGYGKMFNLIKKY